MRKICKFLKIKRKYNVNIYNVMDINHVLKKKVRNGNNMIENIECYK